MVDNEEPLEPQFEPTGLGGGAVGVCWGQLPFKNKRVFLLESEFCVGLERSTQESADLST